MPSQIVKIHDDAHNDSGEVPEMTGDGEVCSCWICGGRNFKEIGRTPNGIKLEVCEECNW